MGGFSFCFFGLRFRARDCGLAAVPMDVDESAYVLIDATASSRSGPAIAVLASRNIAPTVMQVWRDNFSFVVPLAVKNDGVGHLCI